MYLWCHYCATCKERKGWKAISIFNKHEQTLERKSTPISMHGDFAATRTWNPLTATAENFLKEFVKANAHFSTQDLVKIVERHQPDRPTDDFLRTWAKNHRVHKGSSSSRSSSLKRVEADWRQLERDLGSALDLEDAVNELKIAGLLLEPEQTAVIFCNPMLLRETLDSLTNKVYVKLCGDGTFRLTEGEWVFMTVGALSKHYAASDGVYYAFRTAFHPLVFGLANKESQTTYQVLFDSLCACAERFAGVDLRSCCHQYHADMHPGEDLAQKSVFINASHVTDWAHLIGACNRPKVVKALVPSDEKIKVFRTGAFATAKNNLPQTGQKFLPLIKRAFFCLRSVPTALLVHSIATVLFQTLSAQQPPEEKAAKALQRHYFVKHSRQQAQAAFGVLDWSGQPTNSTRLSGGAACSGSSLARLQAPKPKSPGNAGSSRNISAFVPVCPPLLNPWQISQNHVLLTFAAKALACQTCLLNRSLTKPYKTVLLDSDALTRQGRSSADQYFRLQAWDRFSLHAPHFGHV